MDRAAGSDHAVVNGVPAPTFPFEQANAPADGLTAHHDVEYASHDEVAYGPTGPGISPEFAHQFMMEHISTHLPMNPVDQTALHYEQDLSHALVAGADHAHEGDSNNIFVIDARLLQNPVLGFDGVGEHHGGHVTDTTGL